jgi:hypothetical protein
MLQVARALVLRLVYCDASRKIALVDCPGAHEVMCTHRGHPFALRLLDCSPECGMEE